jgi:hypothetical protein
MSSIRQEFMQFKDKFISNVLMNGKANYIYFNSHKLSKIAKN